MFVIHSLELSLTDDYNEWSHHMVWWKNKRFMVLIITQYLVSVSDKSTHCSKASNCQLFNENWNPKSASKMLDLNWAHLPMAKT